ncbi:MAG: PAS domain S-box protein, partial [Candidatus Lokiarchaeota archaeon]|nr:PAS domain S-box protein [Candidatus Lokiarchaeota archaeon]
KEGHFFYFELKRKELISERYQEKVLLIFKDISNQKKVERSYHELQNQFEETINSIPEIRFWKLLSDKRQVHLVNQSYRMLQNVIETIPHLIAWKDINLTYLGCNKNYAHFLGFENVVDIIGKTDEKLIKNKNRRISLNQKEVNVMVTGSTEYHLIENWSFKDGRTKWLDANRIPIKDSNNIVRGVLISYEDITDKKHTQEQLERSEERYRSLIDTSSMGIVEYDVKKKKVVFLNPKILSLLDLEARKLKVRKGFYKLIHPKDLHKFYNLPDKEKIEFRILNNSGNYIWLRGSIIKIYDEVNKLIKIRFWLKNITERKIYEKLSEELSSNFLNFTADFQKNIQLLLKSCCKLLNGDLALYIRKEIVDGKEFYKIVTSENEYLVYDLDFFQENIFAQIFFQESTEFPKLHKRRENPSLSKRDPFIERIDAKAIYGKQIRSQNKLNSILCIFFKQIPNILKEFQIVVILTSDAIEIERRRWEVQKSLEDQNKSLNEINKLKTELLSRISHELKTPLISIKGFTDLLLNFHQDNLDYYIVSILKEIQKGSNRLEVLIRSMIESSKLDKDRVRLNRKKENLSFLIEYCVDALRTRANLRQQKISLEIPENIYTLFDKERIYEVLYNLIGIPLITHPITEQ